MSDESASPFLALPPTAWLASNALAFAIPDGYPVSVGHTLIVPRRLIASWWEATEAEREALLALADDVKALLEQRHAPDGWNLGVNVGRAAGQTVAHLHLHVIPRYDGDVADPRGGVRHALAGKGNWQTLAAEDAGTYAPHNSDVRLFDGVRRPLGSQLALHLRDPSFDRLDVAVAFALPSGVEAITPALADGLDAGLQARLLVSDYLDVTDPHALELLLDLADAAAPGRLTLKVAETAHGPGFHAKSYLFSSSDGHRSACLVGSSNLTAPALDGNVEWNVEVDRITAFRQAFAGLWSQAATLDRAWVAAYRRRRKVLPAGTARPASEVEEETLATPEPRAHQREVLDALADCRSEGHEAGLVVMATGGESHQLAEATAGNEAGTTDLTRRATE